MTGTTNARLAGFASFTYLVAGIGSLAVAGQAPVTWFVASNVVPQPGFRDVAVDEGVRCDTKTAGGVSGFKR